MKYLIRIILFLLFSSFTFAQYTSDYTGAHIDSLIAATGYADTVFNFVGDVNALGDLAVTGTATVSAENVIIAGDTTAFRTFSDLKYQALDTDLDNPDIALNLLQDSLTVKANRSELGTGAYATIANYATLASPTFSGQITHTGIKVYTGILNTSHTLGADSCYGMILYVTGARTITLPTVAVGMSVTFITIGANEVVIEPGSIDLDGEQMYLDGTLLDANDSATNFSTAGDLIVFTYYSAGVWYAASDGWTDED